MTLLSLPRSSSDYAYVNVAYLKCWAFQVQCQIHIHGMIMFFLEMPGSLGVCPVFDGVPGPSKIIWWPVFCVAEFLSLTLEHLENKTLFPFYTKIIVNVPKGLLYFLTFSY